MRTIHEVGQPSLDKPVSTESLNSKVPQIKNKMDGDFDEISFADSSNTPAKCCLTISEFIRPDIPFHEAGSSGLLKTNVTPLNAESFFKIL